MRRRVELQIITEALSKLGPHTPAARIWGRAPGAGLDEGASGNVWAADIHDLALHICTRLYGRPDTTPPASPLAQAGAAKRARDLGAEVGVLMGAYDELTSAPWYPVRPGDLVHVAYEETGRRPAFGETYIVRDAIDEARRKFGGLLCMELLAHTLPDSVEADGMTGCYAVVADDPLYEAWFEAGPHRLSIVRDGRVVHNGGAR